jgi:hypothetical protein
MHIMDLSIFQNIATNPRFHPTQFRLLLFIRCHISLYSAYLAPLLKLYIELEHTLAQLTTQLSGCAIDVSAFIIVPETTYGFVTWQLETLLRTRAIRSSLRLTY